MKSFILFAAFAVFAILFGISFENQKDYVMAILSVVAMVIIVAVALVNPKIKIEFQQ